jgi:hypothetical protein
MIQLDLSNLNQALPLEVRLTHFGAVAVVRFLDEGVVVEIQNASGVRIIGSWATLAEIAAGLPLGKTDDDDED